MNGVLCFGDMGGGGGEWEKVDLSHGIYTEQRTFGISLKREYSLNEHCWVELYRMDMFPI